MLSPPMLDIGTHRPAKASLKGVLRISGFGSASCGSSYFLIFIIASRISGSSMNSATGERNCIQYILVCNIIFEKLFGVKEREILWN